MYSTYETPFAGASPTRPRSRTKRRSSSSAAGRTASARASSSTIAAVHAAYALADAGYESIMVNCNPETVSTDYDTSDRLYFEPLTAEDVLEILRAEQAAGTLHGVIVQFGGQTPLKLADALEKAGIPILGTSPDMIDLAEDRDRFQKLLVKLDLKQPKNGIAWSVEQARTVASELGFPLVVRPSYVLGGRAMQIIHDEAHAADLSARHRARPRARGHQAEVPQRQDRPDQHAARQKPAALRHLSVGSRRGRRRLPLRRQTMSMSRASWSTSRRPASIRATAPARCPSARSRPRPSPSSSARRRLSPARSMSAA
jgi:hypothetical protein